VKAKVASRHKWVNWRLKMFVASSVLLSGTVVGLIYYWIDFCVKGGVQAVNEDWHTRFEEAFTAADLWTAACALVGASGLLAGQTYGVLFTFITASSLIFLGLMDVNFNIQNDLYRLIGKSGQMKFELFINLWTFGLGITLIALFRPRLTLI
jgi:hypothetical protein